jgi:hypothetical protein
VTILETTTGGAHCTGVGCEHDPHAVRVPAPLDVPRHRRADPARHLPGQPPSRPTSSTRSTGTP